MEILSLMAMGGGDGALVPKKLMLLDCLRAARIAAIDSGGNPRVIVRVMS